MKRGSSQKRIGVMRQDLSRREFVASAVACSVTDFDVLRNSDYPRFSMQVDCLSDHREDGEEAVRASSAGSIISPLSRPNSDLGFALDHEPRRRRNEPVIEHQLLLRFDLDSRSSADPLGDDRQIKDILVWFPDLENLGGINGDSTFCGGQRDVV